MDKNTKEINLGKIGHLIITKEMQNMIDALHKSVGSTEWSGILFYKITNGNIKNLKDLEFTADFVYPMNIGSSAYTEFDYSSELVDAYDIYEPAMERSTGLIHSHHSMGAFFSPTDTDELKSNCGNFNFYISLIVNFDGKYCAKIALPSKSNSKTKVSYLDESGKSIYSSFSRTEEAIIIGELDVIREAGEQVPEWLSTRITKLFDKKKEDAAIKAKASISAAKVGSMNGVGRSYSFYAKQPVDDPNDLLGQSDAFPVSKKKYTGVNYLSALLSLDSNKTNESVYSMIRSLNDIDDADLEIYSEAIDNNSDIIYEALFPEDTTYDKIVPVTKDALNHLMMYEKTLGKNPVFNMLKQSLREYATHYE